MTKSTPEENKKHRFLADLRREWQAGELDNAQISRLESLGISKHSRLDVVVGVNDLATTNPDIAAQWHPVKNRDLTPRDVKSMSDKRVWWRCEKGHEWEATVGSRSSGSSCPYCSGLKALPGVSDLATVNPDLAAEWHPVKNGSLTPRDVKSMSGRKAWWLGPCGHEWEAKIADRNNGGGCPVCAGKRVLPGFNDLATVNPGLAAQWHPTRNGNLIPRDVTAGSGKKVWWLGECGHEWEARVDMRAAGSCCPYCSSKKALAGFNDLAAAHPDLAAEWHPSMNGNLTPQDVTARSHRKVWWLGPCGHEWEAQIARRSNGTGCPYCANRRVLVGFNDLATANPDLAAQWHPAKNGDLTPQDVLPSGKMKVWWLGECGHEWEATIDNRSRGRGCPICIGKSILEGFNDLAATHPDLAAEWHPSRNGELTPQDVTAGSRKKVWWLGECGHEWETVIASRSKGTGCPVCYRNSRKKKDDRR